MSRRPYGRHSAARHRVRRGLLSLLALGVAGALGGTALAMHGDHHTVAVNQLTPTSQTSLETSTDSTSTSPLRHGTRKSQPRHHSRRSSQPAPSAIDSTESTPAAPPVESEQLRAGARAAVAYAGAHGMTSGVAVFDTATGQLTTAGAATRRFASASVVKTMIATRLLLDHAMAGRTAALARAMITRSDNDAAWTLYPKVGGDALLPWIAEHYQVSGLGAPPSMKGIWGSTQITAAGLVRFYAAVKKDGTVWPWLSNAMHAFQPRSAAGEPNAFGIAAVAPRAAVKNGWDTDRDVAHPTNAIINSTGFIDGDRYAIAILSEGPESLYYSGGEAIVTHEARLLLAQHPARSSTATTPTRPTVVLDPGHNGGNASHAAQIDRLVPEGYGRMKPCNTTGTETDAGYPEHAFTWDVAKRVRKILVAHGLYVIMTRHNDSGVGPCVNRRAAIESGGGVVAAVAIHADGAPADGHGFHICEDSRTPIGASHATVLGSRTLSTDLHNALAASSGLVPSTYIGQNGYYLRDDLAGLNLSTNPTSFLELGNMRNAHDARLQSSARGRERIARAVASGILTFLGR